MLALVGLRVRGHILVNVHTTTDNINDYYHWPEHNNHKDPSADHNTGGLRAIDNMGRVCHSRDKQLS
jgi:hypothetical protein